MKAKVGHEIVGAAVHHNLERLLPLCLQLFQLRVTHLFAAVAVKACA